MGGWGGVFDAPGRWPGILGHRCALPQPPRNMTTTGNAQLILSRSLGATVAITCAVIPDGWLGRSLRRPRALAWNSGASLRSAPATQEHDYDWKCTTYFVAEPKGNCCNHLRCHPRWVAGAESSTPQGAGLELWGIAALCPSHPGT